MYIIKCYVNGTETYLRRTGNVDEFTQITSQAKQFKKELAAEVAIRHLKENNRGIKCETVNINPQYVRVFI